METPELMPIFVVDSLFTFELAAVESVAKTSSAHRRSSHNLQLCRLPQPPHRPMGTTNEPPLLYHVPAAGDA